MPTERQSRGLDYGAAAAGTNVDFAEDANIEAVGIISPFLKHNSRHK